MLNRQGTDLTGAEPELRGRLTPTVPFHFCERDVRTGFLRKGRIGKTQKAGGSGDEESGCDQGATTQANGIKKGHREVVEAKQRSEHTNLPKVNKPSCRRDPGLLTRHT